MEFSVCNKFISFSFHRTMMYFLGNHYTAEYCKKRITTLREQYVKFKKEYDLKSGSASCTKKKSSLLSQFSFINEYIQRRRSVFYI